jgi:2'-5' RNA ligase
MHKKYFIAIVLKDELLAKAEHLKNELFNKYGLKGSLRSPAHITLHRPFQWKEEKENEIINALEQFERFNQFELQLNNFGCFEPRVIYIDVKRNDNLSAFQKKLARHAASKLKLLNEIDDLRGFHPHITIAFRDLKKPLFYSLWEDFKHRTFTGTMRVNSFSLLRLEDKWEEIKIFDI